MFDHYTECLLLFAIRALAYQQEEKHSSITLICIMKIAPVAPRMATDVLMVCHCLLLYSFTGWWMFLRVSLWMGTWAGSCSCFCCRSSSPATTEVTALLLHFPGLLCLCQEDFLDGLGAPPPTPSILLMSGETLTKRILPPVAAA